MGAVRGDTVRELTLQDASSPAATCVPIARTGMSKGGAEATAAVFKALADPARVRVVNLLAASGEPVCVCHLTDLLELSQPTVSFHMRKLMDAGLLDREQRGVWAYYSLRADAKRRLSAILTFDEADLGEEEDDG
ncbi:MAG: helix-turn-helix transcriptional regulator [Actinobacteria bacterium]|nr:helix-turn-helix transcriptional regulator [Actinomycetota bacterium]